MKILIADDHTLFRDGLKKILSENFNNSFFGEAGNEHELLDLVKNKSWDILILDLSMPGRSGLDSLKAIKQFKPDLPILILSMYPEDQFAVRVIKAGASGYITKGSSPKELISAINVVCSGRTFINQNVADLITSNLRDGDKPLHKLLTDREYEVFLELANGKSVSETAKKFLLSVKTISTYRTNILKKLQVKNNSELIYYSIKNKLV